MFRKIRKAAALLLAAGIVMGSNWTGMSVTAAEDAVALFPGVTPQMADPDYWAAVQELKEEGSAVKLRASSFTIDDLNQKILQTPGCAMNDLTKAAETFDADKLMTGLAGSWESDRAYFRNSGAIYDINGNVADENFYNVILANMINPAMTGTMHVIYGICTERTDLRTCPTTQILTDDPADVDFDYFQSSLLRVNEPVIVKTISTDGQWYLVDSTACSGWVRASDIALCRTKSEWEDAWKIPADQVLVVTGGKIYLEKSNHNVDISGRLLTMGTVLRIAKSWEYTGKVTNRSPIQNYAVWMPLRDKNGYYSKKVVLISQHSAVSVGYLPLTSQNVLRVAFSMLGDAYGWGAMLDSADCSSYIRDIYKCFGLELPRNTTWQEAMPVVKCEMGKLPQNAEGDAVKAALLDTLPPGAVLYFPGHTMMYLGKVDGNYYVISSVSSVADPETGKYLRVRSVVVNTLGMKRMSGKTWMNCLDMALIPYEGAAVQ